LNTLGLRDPAFLEANGVSGITPASYANLILWLKADSFSLADGTAIGGTGNEWQDQSSSNNDAVQATGSKQPLFKTNIIGSKPVIRFDGSNDELTINDLNLTADFTIILIGSVTADSIILGKAAANYQVRIYRSSANTLSAYDSNEDKVSSTLGNPQTSVRCMTWRRNVKTLTFRENTTARGTQTWSLLNTLPLVTIGQTGGFSFYAGDVAELVVYNALLADADVDNLYTLYFSPRWGLP
jgi:hypothetical protein